MNSLYEKNVKDLKEENTFIDILRKSYVAIKPSKRRVVIMICIAIIVSIPLINSINGDNTKELAIKTMELSNDIIKDLFAINFTGYALFQALVSSSTLKQMLSSNVKEMSIFKRFNLFFFAICIMYIGIILFNYLGLIIIQMVDPSYFTIDEKIKGIFLYIIGIVYIIVNSFAIIEIKSFIVNMYNCFNINAIAESIKELKK